MELVIRLRDSSFRAEIGWISKTSFYIVLVTDQLSHGAICANKIMIKPAHAKSDGQRSAGSKVFWKWTDDHYRSFWLRPTHLGGRSAVY